MGANHPEPGQPGDPAQDHIHEHKDVQIKGIVVFAVVLALITVAIELFLGVWLNYYAREEQQIAAQRPARMTDLTGQFPEPRLQGNPGFDMKAFQAEQTGSLEAQAWIEPNRIARLPIDRAMRIIAEQGLPVRPTAAAASAPVTP